MEGNGLVDCNGGVRSTRAVPGGFLLESPLSNDSLLENRLGAALLQPKPVRSAHAVCVIFK